MERGVNAGRFLLAIAFAGFAVQCAICATGGTGPRIAAPWICGPAYSAWMIAAAFLVVAVSLASGKVARAILVGFGCALFLFAVGFYIPKLMTHPHNPAPWTSGFEVLSICGGCWILAQAFPGDWKLTITWMALAGRALLAIALVVFAVQHFLYARFVGSLVCAWIPWHLFWAYFTGVAFAAAALSIATGVLLRVASLMLGVMFFLWAILLHAPRVFSAPGSGDEWTSTLVAVAMSGVAFALAGAGRGGFAQPVTGDKRACRANDL
jgi:hypothetical protein